MDVVVVALGVSLIWAGFGYMVVRRLIVVAAVQGPGEDLVDEDDGSGGGEWDDAAIAACYVVDPNEYALHDEIGGLHG